MTMRSPAMLFAVALAFVAAGSCLPADDRPPPGSLLLTVSPSPAVHAGTVTEDGWSVSFDRVVIGIGRASLGDGCVSYSEARYDRVLDVVQGAGQKLSILYGLGACDVRFGIAPPGSDALLGVGVTEDIKTLMRTPGADAYLPNSGITLILEGRASKSGIAKTFHWNFRQSYRYEDCTVEVDGQPVAGVDLTGNAEESYDIAIAPERLFLDDLALTAVLRFEPFAQADDTLGDGDGEVLPSELAKVQLDELRGTAPYGVADQDPASIVKTLQDYVFLLLFPRVPRFRDTGSCTPTVGRGGHHD